jgi:hypothetical protein
MPNWVSIVANFEGEQKDIDNIFNLIKGVDENGEATKFDFNRLIPMPEELDIESGGRGITGLAYLFRHAESSDEEEIIAKAYSNECMFDDIRTANVTDDIDEGTIKMGRQYLSNHKKYGYCTWYRWTINNWGTKWNACNVSVGEKSIYLDTAWSFPVPIFEKLIEICHENNVVMSGYFCDEDYMSRNKGYFHSGDDHNTEGIEYLDCTDLENEDFKEIFINCLGEDWYEEALEYQREEEDEAV